jgi:L-ribulose-5-phosphate 4-epimerase
MDDLKQRIATCCRLMCMEGLFDWSGHVSARVPGTSHILIHPRNVSRLEVTAQDILTVDLDGKVIEGQDLAPGEVWIHTSIYKARADVLSVAHIHSKFAILSSMREKEFLPVSRLGLFFLDGIPTLPYFLNINTPALGDSVAQALGSHRAVFLKGHGSVIVEKSVERVFFSSLSLEKECEYQVWAAALGDVNPFGKDTPPSYSDESRNYRKWWDYSVSKARKMGFL